MTIFIFAFFISFYNIYLSLLIYAMNLYLNLSWEDEFKFLTFFSAMLCFLITVGIIFSLIWESWLFLQYVSIQDFLFGINWSPQNGATDGFGILPLILGTFLISIISACISFPLGLLTAICLTQYLSSRIINIIYPLINLLAAIPTIIYGLFAIAVVGPFLNLVNSNIAHDSALIVGIIIGIMTIPIVTIISFDGIRAVPKSLYHASYGLGANKAETLINVILPTAMPNIISSFLLAFSRSIGETMIVVMVSGLKANLTLNPMHSVTTITAQIVNLLTGDIEFNNPITLSAFALAMVLFIITMIINIIAINLTNKYKYDF